MENIQFAEHTTAAYRPGGTDSAHHMVVAVLGNIDFGAGIDHIELLAAVDHYHFDNHLILDHSKV